MKTFFTLSVCILTLVSNAQSWHPLGTGLNGAVTVILPYSNSIYVGGHFTNAGGDPEADYLARWDGTDWYAVIPGLNGPVSDILFTENSIFVGGAFTEPFPYALAFDNDFLLWYGIGNELTGPVKKMAYRSDGLYAAGEFEGKIAHWVGNKWIPLAGGVSGEVNALILKGEDLYVGGEFTVQGGYTRCVDIWRNGAWMSIPQPSDIRNVYDLAFYHHDLYLAGYPKTYCQGGMGGIHDPIMRWDGDEYHTLGHFGGCRVASNLCLHGQDLYVDAIDPLGEEAVFKWDPQLMDWTGFLTWFLEVPEDQILSLVTDGPDVYIGGLFTDFEGIYGDHIARWAAPITSAVDLGKQTDVELRLYPNPADHTIHIDIANDHAGICTYTLYDATGMILFQSVTNDRMLDVSQLATGVYFLKVQTKAYNGIGKFIRL